MRISCKASKRVVSSVRPRGNPPWNISQRLEQKGQIPYVAALFLIGTGCQVIGAVIKIGNWYVYRGTFDKPYISPSIQSVAMITQVQVFGTSMDREKARQRTRDAMVRKAQAGHVTGGACFGYRTSRSRASAGLPGDGLDPAFGLRVKPRFGPLFLALTISTCVPPVTC
jgi:hypothetical protein